MLRPYAVAYHEAKAGNADTEWEDGAGYDSGDLPDGQAPRYIVLDGATEAYDSIRWVGMLADSFLGITPDGGRPELTASGLGQWFEVVQRRWIDTAPASFSSIYEEQKFNRDGSFATFVGCELDDLNGGRPRWTAMALGDAVLFHVRDGTLVQHFPPLSADEFGLNPDGIFTRTSALPRMRDRLARAEGEIRLGDWLFLVSDAMADWMVRTGAVDGGPLWSLLADLTHPDSFRELIGGLRRSHQMKNDDVTLLRVQIVESIPDFLAVCT